MSRPLGEYNYFAVECRVLDRTSGEVEEALYEFPSDNFHSISFLDGDDHHIVQSLDEEGVAEYEIIAEIDVPSHHADSWSMAQKVAEALPTEMRVISENGSERYYVVREVHDD